MTPFHLLLLWIVSLLAATYLGYDRGRWETGLVLGLVCGPVGVIAAGMLAPAPVVDAAQKYQVELEMDRLRRDVKERAKQRRQSARAFDDLVHALEEQVEGERVGFVEELEGLAAELEELVRADPQREAKLRNWIAWLTQRAEAMRARGGMPDEQY